MKKSTCVLLVALGMTLAVRAQEWQSSITPLSESQGLAIQGGQTGCSDHQSGSQACGNGLCPGKTQFENCNVISVWVAGGPGPEKTVDGPVPSGRCTVCTSTKCTQAPSTAPNTLILCSGKAQ